MARPRWVHDPLGVVATQQNGSTWTWGVLDALGSQRAQVSGGLVAARHFSEYGVVQGQHGTFSNPMAFTGEPLDANGLQYHRARYYAPTLGIFPSLDPFEGMTHRPMSLNGYSWVEGNTPNRVDPSGMECESLEDKLIGTDGYWCRKLQETLYTTLQMPPFEEVLYCYSCAMDSFLGSSPDAYEQGLRQAEMDGMASPQRIQMAIDEFRRNYISPIASNSGGLDAVYSTLGVHVNGYAEGWATAASALVVSGQAGMEVTYDFATFQRMRFVYEGYGGILGNLLQGMRNLSGGVGVSLSNYTGLITGFTNHRHCGAGDPFEHFTNEYSGAFIVNNVGAALYGGGGGVEFHSPDGSIAGAGMYLSLGAGLDVGYSRVNYRRIYGSEKSYINPIDGKVNVFELTTDILYGRGIISLAADLPIASDILQGFREEAATVAEFLAMEYNSSEAARPCSC